ncbi:MFS general substrate transporter [Aspergillus homomorphus CBS 101889]|uniref:MFS general substrate transporter n=1 Tax=Aspergillus homomorphus (strain CBS 101889) TaxID=1450537 RepID=A0A395HLU5_ASPHC|nr:MFS general substrate transporter [Aspergillus homomorphus CBS 101889]RAL08901.1 MFS general substrate transporter [Aspergillus homomorphus CBS 101889]
MVGGASDGWNSPNDPENPFNWSPVRKWFVTGLGLLASFETLINGTIITVAHEAINHQFGVSDASFPNSYWPVASWGFGGATFSLIVLPIMEDFGIRWVFLAIYLCFLCFLVPQAVAQNFATLVVTRFFTGGCVAILANTVAGVIGNIWSGDRARTLPISLYITIYMISSSIGPVVGASIFEYLSWRWIGYIELIWTGVLFPVFLLAFPETRASAIQSKRARKLGRTTEAATELKNETQGSAGLLIRLSESIKRPLYMLFTESVVFVATLWSAFSLGTIYVFTQSAEQVFNGLYGWNATQAGYVQAAIVIGELFGFVLCQVCNRWYFASASRNPEIPGKPIPEARLYAAIIGGVLGNTGGMLIYAWTAYRSLPFIAPAIGLAMVGMGSTAVVISIVTYLLDAYAHLAGSAIAAVGLGENVFLALLPLATQSMYTTLGFHWASFLLGMISLLLAMVPFVMLRWGAQIRARSPLLQEALVLTAESMSGPSEK